MTHAEQEQRDAKRRARWEHLCNLFDVQFQDDPADAMTEANWQECQRRQEWRNWQADDAQAHAK